MKKFASTALIALSALTLQACSSTPESTATPNAESHTVVTYTTKELEQYMQAKPLNDLTQEQTAIFYLEFRKEEAQAKERAAQLIQKADNARAELEAAGNLLIKNKGRHYAMSFYKPIEVEIHTHLEATLFAVGTEFDNIPQRVNQKTLDNYLKALRSDFYVGEIDYHINQHALNLKEAAQLLRDEANK